MLNIQAGCDRLGVYVVDSDQRLTQERLSLSPKQFEQACVSNCIYVSKSGRMDFELSRGFGAGFSFLLILPPYTLLLDRVVDEIATSFDMIQHKAKRSLVRSPRTVEHGVERRFSYVFFEVLTTCILWYDLVLVRPNSLPFSLFIRRKPESKNYLMSSTISKHGPVPVSDLILCPQSRTLTRFPCTMEYDRNQPRCI